MSIERRQRQKGTVWIVRWREPGGFRSRTFDRKRDAQAFDAKLRLAKRRGGLEELDAGRQSLREFLDEWWRLYAEHHLTAKTLKLYAGFRDLPPPKAWGLRVASDHARDGPTATG